MICQRIIFCDHGKKNCICHSMCYIKESTYRMAHGMDISKSCKGKGDSCKKRSRKHCLCSFQICTSCHKTADISADQLHCFLCHCVRKRRCCCGNISLLRMNKCIDSAGCCHRCRSRCEKFRIQDRICRKKFITEYRQLIISAVVSDNRKCRNL